MEHQTEGRRRVDGFSISKVKENVVGLLFVTTVMGVVGFIVGTRERVDDLDVQHRKALIELRDLTNHHTYQLKQIEDFHNDGPRFTLGMGEDLRRDCVLIQNDVEHWTGRIMENAQGLKEVEAECRNLISKTWEQMHRNIKGNGP